MVKVFLVEDEAIIRRGIKKNVEWEKNGFTFVGEAGDGKYAYPQILKTEPDILITDIKMPFMDGLELSHLVKKILPNTKIIILSGYNEFEYAKEAITIGISEYLLKPVTAASLTAVLRKVMDVNFWGTVYCSKYALPYLLESKGSLVGVISIAGFIGLPGRTGYAASKFAVRGFLNTVRIENMKKGLHVMVAAPGFTASNIRKTALNANGRQQGESPRNENKMMTAEKCAAIIVKGIRKRKREIIMTFVEGKLAVFLSKWLPGLVDRLSYSLMAKEPDSPFK